MMYSLSLTIGPQTSWLVQGMNGMGHRKHIGRVALAVLGLGVLLSGCMETVQPASDANLTPLDRRLLANAPYARATISEQYQRHIVEYPRREAPGTILVDTDARYLYYVLPEGKAIRYGVTVGEEALSWSGVAKVGRLAEWPSWTPTQKSSSVCTCRTMSARARKIRWVRAPCIVRGQQGHPLPHPRYQPAGIYRP